MATAIIRVFLWSVALICTLASCQAFVVHGRNEAGEQTVTSETDNNDGFMTEMMTAEEEAEIDAMFPDQMRDNLKLELILKALTILKTYEGHSISLTGWFPSYDVMPEELKLRLILKALVLLKERPLNSMFAEHIVAQLKLTLVLKAISILGDSSSDFDLKVDTDDLKLALLLKAIDILEVYDGELEDTVFFTESKKQLKLALILKAIELLKRGNWPINIKDLWSMVEQDEGEVPEGGQSETTTPEERTTAEEATSRPVTMEAIGGGDEATVEQEGSIVEEDEGEVPEGGQSETTTPEERTTAEKATSRPVTMEAIGGGDDEATVDQEGSIDEEDEGEVPEGGQSETTTPEERTTAEEATSRPVTMEAIGGGDEATRKPWIKKGISKFFKFFKWVPKILHKKKHLIFH